jgi:hypothetical protein
MQLLIAPPRQQLAQTLLQEVMLIRVTVQYQYRMKQPYVVVYQVGVPFARIWIKQVANIKINIVNGVIILVITTTTTTTDYRIYGPMEHIHNIHKTVNTIQQQQMLVLVMVVYVSWSKGNDHQIHLQPPFYLHPHPRLNVIIAHL